MKRKKFRRCVCMILAVSMCICMQAALCVTGFAADETVLTVNTPDVFPAVGQEFTVTVTITNNPGICAAQFTLQSDSTVECTSAEIGKVLSGSLAATNPSGDKGAIIAAANLSKMKDDGELGVFTYKMKSSGTPAFKIVNCLLSDENTKDVSYTVKSGTISSDSKVETGTAGTGLGSYEGSASTSTDTAAADTTAQTTTTGSAAAAETRKTDASVAFPDVASSQWFYEFVSKAVAAGLFKGYENGNFGPLDNVTRVQFITVLWRQAGSPEVSDAAAFNDFDSTGSSDYAKAVRWGYKNGYITGIKNSDGSLSLDPNGTITRQDAMTILFRYDGGTSGLESMLSGTYDSQFSDSASIASYAKDAVYWAIYNGHISGVGDNKLDPKGLATRAQLAKILVKYMESKNV